MEGSNLRFLIQSQASYHWTNPQNWRGGAGINSGPAAAGKGNRPAISNMIIPAGRFVKGQFSNPAAEMTPRRQYAIISAGYPQPGGRAFQRRAFSAKEGMSKAG